jgi:hypothetical protein
MMFTGLTSCQANGIQCNPNIEQDGADQKHTISTSPPSRRGIVAGD